jgi:peptidoglycan L-alanyl-D-glutamate endopeptidase CwlK
MAFKLSARSLRELDGVHPSLAAVVKRAIQTTTQDFLVFDGIRTIEEQREHVRKGNSKTMKSKHLEGRAVDLVPWINDGPTWSPASAFDPICKAMKDAAKELGVPIRWGGDWSTFIDKPHYELPDGWEPAGDAPKAPDKPLRPIPEATHVEHRPKPWWKVLIELILAMWRRK